MSHAEPFSPAASGALTRRRFLAASGAAICAGHIRTAQAASRPGLSVMGAPTGATVVLAQFMASGGLAQAAPGSRFAIWHSIDELRAAIVSGRTELFSTPTCVPANLAVRGMPLKMLCVLDRGHLCIVSANPGIHSLHDLAGRPLTGFFRHDMPDLVFRAVARMEGMNPDRDMKLSYVQSGIEGAQMLASGRAESAILSEPAATSAIVMAEKKGRKLYRAISFQEIWSRHKGTRGIPMVGIALHADLMKKSPEILAALHTGLPAAEKKVLSDRRAAAALAGRMMEVRPPVFAAAMDHYHIALRSARAAKADLIDFYRTILELEPRALGGRLPPDDFYLDM